MKVSILGTGSYGLSLATMIVQNTKELVMYTPIEEECQMLKKNYESPLLKDISLDKHITFTASLETALSSSDIILITTPTQYLASLFSEMKDQIKKDQMIIVGSKGLLDTTPPWIHKNIETLFPDTAYGILSGPSFALDIANQMPIGLTFATKNERLRHMAASILETPTLKLEYTDDLLGVEICGTLKNIFAIGSGILEGLKLTESTKALYFNTSMVEARNILKDMNCNIDTIFTHAGIGDMYLTMSSIRSRNYLYGTLLGSKRDADEITTFEIEHTIEGRNGVQQILPMLAKHNIQNEFITLLYQIIYEKKDPCILIEYLNK